MRSDLQIQASRANGSKSRGPITEEGKLASSRNALKHGILSETVLLPGENPASFEADAQDLFDEHKPLGHTEQELVEIMIVARWRRTRIWMLERTCLAGQMHQEYLRVPESKPDPTTAAAIAFRNLADHSRTLDLVNRYESRYDRQYFRAHHRLLEVQDRRMRNEPDNTPPASGPVDSTPPSVGLTVAPLDPTAAPVDHSGAPITPSVSAGNSFITKRTQAEGADVENTTATSRRPFYLTTFLLSESPETGTVFHAAAGIHPS
jgi:hypothetical protein